MTLHPERISASMGCLTPIDKEIITQQLTNQEADTEEERLHFTAAYAEAKRFSETNSLENLTEEHVAELILQYARQVYPLQNYFGLRSVQPIHGKTSEPLGLPPGRMLESAIITWCQEFAAGEKSADELYYEFECIHPFNDGNGRVGHLMWAIDMVRRTKEWPQTLPKEYSELAAIFASRSGY